MTTPVPSTAAATGNGVASGLGMRVAAGVAWGAGARAVQLLTQLGASVVLARLLWASDFGVVNLSAVFLNFANALADFGIRTYLVQKKDLGDEDVESAKLLSWGLGAAVFVAGVAAAVPLAAFYREPRLAPVLMVQSLAYLLLNAAAVPSALLLRKLEYGRISRIEIASGAAYLVATCGLALAGAGYWSLVAGRLISGGVGFALLASTVSSPLPRLMPIRKLQPALHFGSFMVIASAIAQLDENFDNIVVGRLFGTDAVGAYSVAYNLAALPQRYVSWTLATIATPALAAASALGRFPEATRHYARFQVLVPAALAVSFGVFAPEVCAILLGPRWTEAPGLVRIMSISTALLSVSTVVAGTLASQGRVRSLVLFNPFKLALTATGVLVGSRFGVRGVAIGYAIANAVALAAGLAFAAAAVGLSTAHLLRSLVRPAVAVALAALVGEASARWFRTYHPPAALTLVVCGGAAALSLVVFARLLCPVEWKEAAFHIARILPWRRSSSDAHADSDSATNR